MQKAYKALGSLSKATNDKCVHLSKQGDIKYLMAARLPLSFRSTKCSVSAFEPAFDLLLDPGPSWLLSLEIFYYVQTTVTMYLANENSN